MPQYADQDLIKMLLSRRPQANRKAWRYLHDQSFGVVKNMIKNKGGTMQDAEDIFQNALVALLQKLKQETFEVKKEHALRNFLVKACRYLWNNELKRSSRKNEFPLDDNMDTSSGEDFFDLTEKEEIHATLLEKIQALDENCQKLLTLSYYDQLKIADIQQQLKLASEAATKMRKRRCLDKLMQLVEADLRFKEWFS